MIELLKKIANYLFNDLSNSFSILYVIILLVGISFEYNYYILFNINILQYADVVDFLLTPVREYWSVLFLVFNGYLMFLFFKHDLWFRTKYPDFYKKMNFNINTESKTYYIYTIVSFLGLFCFYTYLSASMYGKIKKQNIEKGQGQLIYLIDAENNKKTYFLIGKTGDYIFLYDEKKQVLVKRFGDNITIQTADFSAKK